MTESVATIRERLRSAELVELSVLVEDYQADHRKGVEREVAAAQGRIDRHASALAVHERLYAFERSLALRGFTCVAGVDEAGRGSLAGPVVAAAVIVGDPDRLVGVKDSKLIDPLRREELYHTVVEDSVAWAVSVVDPGQIDRLGIAEANRLALTEAIALLPTEPDYVLCDAFSIECGVPTTALIKGDRLSLTIGAASIVAKVTRDRIMSDLGRLYPEYGLAENKGYGTVDHLAAIRSIGPCQCHRRSFSPVASEQMSLL